jgi:hypothetical protein
MRRVFRRSRRTPSAAIVSAVRPRNQSAARSGPLRDGPGPMRSARSATQSTASTPRHAVTNITSGSPADGVGAGCFAAARTPRRGVGADPLEGSGGTR